MLYELATTGPDQSQGILGNKALSSDNSTRYYSLSQLIRQNNDYSRTGLTKVHFLVIIEEGGYN
jgi:hypothetical protein